MPWADPYLGSKDAQVELFDGLANQYAKCKKEIIGYSVEGKPIPMYRVGNPSGGKFMFDGAIHGCSDVSTMAHHLFLKWLLESHARVAAGSVDPWDLRAHNIIEKKCLLAVPVFNIDRATRKNARNGYWPNGVDLNRNFTYNWANAGTTDPINDYYRGPSAASEPETQAIKGVFAREVPEVYCNFHNWGGLLFRSSYVNSAQKAFSQQIADAYTAIRTQLGITDTIYSYGSGGPGAGYSSADAAVTPGVKASFLVEVCRMSTIETTRPSWITEPGPYPLYRYITDPFYLDQAQTQRVIGFYPRILPILIAMAEAVSDGPPITPKKYVFKQWHDGDTNPTKTINV